MPHRQCMWPLCQRNHVRTHHLSLRPRRVPTLKQQQGLSTANHGHCRLQDRCLLPRLDVVPDRGIDTHAEPCGDHIPTI